MAPAHSQIVYLQVIKKLIPYQKKKKRYNINIILGCLKPLSPKLPPLLWTAVSTSNESTETPPPLLWKSIPTSKESSETLPQFLNSHKDQPTNTNHCKMDEPSSNQSTNLQESINTASLSEMVDKVSINCENAIPSSTITTEKNIDAIKRDVKIIKKKVANMEIMMEQIIKYFNMEIINAENNYFPIQSTEDLQSVELKLLDKNFSDNVTKLMRKLVPNNKRLSKTIREIIEPKVLINFNWDGRHNKSQLSTYKLFATNLMDATSLNKTDFIKEIRRAILRAHNYYYVGNVRRT